MRGQALVEFAIITPILLMLILGGAGVGLLLLNRMELQHAAQEAATSGAIAGGCSGALGVVPRILGSEPDDKACEEVGQIVEVTLSRRSATIVPLVPLPEFVTVTARALVRPEPSASPSASPEP